MNRHLILGLALGLASCMPPAAYAEPSVSLADYDCPFDGVGQAVQLRVTADLGLREKDIYKMSDSELAGLHWRIRTKALPWATHLKTPELQQCYGSWLVFFLGETEKEDHLRKIGLGHESDMDSEWDQARTQMQRIPRVP